jgi:hypothetical protein
MEQRYLISHAEAEKVFRRAGYSQEWIENALRQLPDPIDPVRDGEALLKLGVSRGALIDRMGGSP